MGNITKSLWTNIKHAVHAIPGSSDLIPWANHAGTDLVTEINECTVAELIAGGGGAVDVGLRRTTITLTDAQIKTLPTAPILIAAAVPGKVYAVINAVTKGNFAAGAYTNIDAGAEIGFTNGVAGDVGDCSNLLANDAAQFAAGANNFLTGIDDIYFWHSGHALQGANNVGTSISGAYIEPQDPGDQTAIGAALYFRMKNGASGNLTGGNAANSCVMEVLYWIA